jgi:hypothetical protein
VVPRQNTKTKQLTTKIKSITTIELNDDINIWTGTAQVILIQITLVRVK